MTDQDRPSHRDLARDLGVSVTTIKSYRRKFPEFLPPASHGKPLRFAPQARQVCRTIKDAFARDLSILEAHDLLKAQFPNLYKSRRLSISKIRDNPFDPASDPRGTLPAPAPGTPNDQTDGEYGPFPGASPEATRDQALAGSPASPESSLSFPSAVSPIPPGLPMTPAPRGPAVAPNLADAASRPGLAHALDETMRLIGDHEKRLGRIEASLENLYNLQNRTHSLQAALLAKLDTLADVLAGDRFARLQATGKAPIRPSRPGEPLGPAWTEPRDHRAGPGLAERTNGPPGATGPSGPSGSPGPSGGVGLSGSSDRSGPPGAFGRSGPFGIADPNGPATGHSRMSPNAHGPAGPDGPNARTVQAATAGPMPSSGTFGTSGRSGLSDPAGDLPPPGRVTSRNGPGDAAARADAPGDGVSARPPRGLLDLPVVIASERGEFLGITGQDGRPFTLDQFERALTRRAAPLGRYTARWSREGGTYVLTMGADPAEPVDKTRPDGPAAAHEHHFRRATTPRGNEVALFHSLRIRGKDVSESFLRAFFRQIKGSLE